MTAQPDQEHKNQPTWESIQALYRQSLVNLIANGSLCPDLVMSAVDDTMDDMLHGRTIGFYSTNVYQKRSQEFTHTSTRVLGGLGAEFPLLIPGVRALVLPYTAFGGDEDIPDEETGAVSQTEGPQAVVYFLDEYTGQEHWVTSLANLAFLNHIVDSMGKFPANGIRYSDAFIQAIYEAYGKVGQLVRSLQPELQAQLDPAISHISELDDKARMDKAVGFALFKTETKKQPGIVELGEHRHDLDPSKSVTEGVSFLRIEQRDLPESVAEASQRPAFPWAEFTANAWDSDAQIAGEYRQEFEDGTLRVGYLLNSTYVPGRYGFLNLIELRITDSEGVPAQHAIVGMVPLDRMDPSTLRPQIVAGDFDFSRLQIREMIAALANDQGTKQGVNQFLNDLLDATERGEIARFKRSFRDKVRDDGFVDAVIKTITARNN